MSFSYSILSSIFVLSFLDENQLNACLKSASARASQIVRYFETTKNKQNFQDVEMDG